MGADRSRLSPPSRDAEKIQAAVARFGHRLVPRVQGDGREEDQIRVPVHDLLKDLGTILGLEVVVHDEVTLSHLRSRPDLAVDTRAGRVGYIELKARDKGLPETSTWR